MRQCAVIFIILKIKNKQLKVFNFNKKLIFNTNDYIKSFQLSETKELQ